MTAPASATSTPAQIANEQAKRLQESSNKIRERAETSAKALSAFGAAALGAAGLSKITDLFPLPADGPTATVGVSAAILGFVMIALSLLLFTRGIWKINRAIVTSTKLEECGPDLDASEKKIFEGEYEKTVALNRAAWALDADASLADYEQRGLEKQSAALGQDEPLRSKTLEDAASIDADVREAQARAAAVVIRERSASIWKGSFLPALTALFVTGLLVFGAGTDILSASRTDSIAATLKACGDASKSLSDGKLTRTVPPACGSTSSSDSSSSAAPAAVRERATTLAALADQYSSCVAKTKDINSADCTPTLDLVRQLAAR